jgi:hypothetical protein
MENCHKLKREWKHVRCHSDRDILYNVDLDEIVRQLQGIGPETRKKGAAWFVQQMLKLGAVAHGLDGLSEHVRVMDGETIIQTAFDWFTPNGDEIFDICDAWSYRKVGDGFNNERYGALYYELTKQALVGSPAMVSHGMSMTRTHVRSLLTAFSPRGASLESNAWVSHSVKKLCDQVAITGFSEYYYYASWVLYNSVTGTNITNQNSPLIRVAKDTCRRVSTSNHRCDAPSLAKYSNYAYIVLENHASRT